MKPMHPDITIFHNPSCSTSRHVLTLIREAGFEPQVVEYLKTPYTREQLAGLLQALGLRPRDVIRRKGDLYTELDLARNDWTDGQLLDLMVSHPALVERPIVVTPLGTRLCRPTERVLEVLPARAA
ncbi:MAG: arsenate reductase (glutaredoxin) [Hydrogenophaga sp.]|nr:arsenate reductase (glutaredoxin) [Hydrogenophaga sp.]